MSATGRGAVRRESDYYPTPAWCVHRLLEALDLPGGRWLEPSAGDGAIIRAVNTKREGVKWTAVEVRPECSAQLLDLADHAIADFLGASLGLGHFDVAILNPPFSDAMAFIDRCKPMATWVCALERLNFLEGDARNASLRSDAPDVFVLPNRPSFTGEGTDSIAYAWFVWGPERNRRESRIVLLPLTPAAERKTPKLVIPELLPGLGLA